MHHTRHADVSRHHKAVLIYIQLLIVMPFMLLCLSSVRKRIIPLPIIGKELVWYRGNCWTVRTQWWWLLNLNWSKLTCCFLVTLNLILTNYSLKFFLTNLTILALHKINSSIYLEQHLAYVKLESFLSYLNICEWNRSKTQIISSIYLFKMSSRQTSY